MQASDVMGYVASGDAFLLFSDCAPMRQRTEQPKAYLVFTPAAF